VLPACSVDRWFRLRFSWGVVRAEVAASRSNKVLQLLPLHGVASGGVEGILVEGGLQRCLLAVLADRRDLYTGPESAILAMVFSLASAPSRCCFLLLH
jgi:hypothetical protein